MNNSNIRLNMSNNNKSNNNMNICTTNKVNITNNMYKNR